MVYYNTPEFEKKQQFNYLMTRLNKLHEEFMTLTKNIHHRQMDSSVGIFTTHLVTVGSLFLSIETIAGAYVIVPAYTTALTLGGIGLGTLASIFGAYSVDAWRNRSRQKTMIAAEKKELNVVNQKYEETNKALDELIH